MKYNELTPDEERVIIRKGTERTFTGEFTNNKESGTYVCRRCNFSTGINNKNYIIYITAS